MNAVEFSERWIAEHAIALITKYGEPFQVGTFPGFAQEAKVGEFSLAYTTPFSGFEVYPGEKMYMVDIWIDRKVFSCVYKTLDELSSTRARKGAWLARYRLLQ